MRKQTRRFISGMMTFVFVFAMTFGNGFNQAKAAEKSSAKTTLEDIKASVANSLIRAYSEKDNANWLNKKYGGDFVVNENKPLNVNPDEIIRVIVQLKDKPLSETGSKGIKSIQSTQASIKTKVQALQGTKIRNTYTNLVNGFSMTIKRSEINKVKNMAGVKSVTEVNKYYADMTSAKALTQAYDAWEHYGYKGEGMVVSIIDTGIDWTHKDMKVTDTSKLKINDKNPKGPGKYFSDKVPYGHNFAEANNTIIPTDSMHGMHVAGIVGANGDDKEVKENKAIQGVAPECQFLAMKVFGNDPEIGGAYSDDIVAAIEDSVNHGADVINMSLGSNSGFQDPEEPEQKAIKNATAKGVMVVVSAGNSQYNTAPYKVTGVYDTEVVGSPGIAKETLQVASYENTNMLLYSLDYTSKSGNGTFNYEVNNVNPCEVFKGDSEIVNCGFGQVSDFTGKDVKGKIVIVSRGNITFAEKEVNAQSAGAKAIIIYNSKAGYIGGMAIDPTVTIPVIGMLKADGAAVISKIQDELKIQFNGKLTAITNPDKNDMSDFTSWGPTPSLDFKPEITAPGGNIWSTVNANKYENMSGTSMAAPHTSGSEALILQSIKVKNLGLTGKDLIDFAKTTSINTAKTLMDKDHNAVPYSPRRQGAGLVQIEDAIKNNVTVKDINDNAAVALKEIGKTTTFALNLKNYSDKEATYDLSDIGGVLTEQAKTSKIMSYDVKINGNKVISYDKNTVTVPAKGDATVNVTITLPDDFDTEQFVEGYVKFTSKTDGTPSLVVPYIGFYGNWSTEDNIDQPMWDQENTLFGKTVFNSLGKDNKTLYYLGYTGDDEDGNPIVDPNKIAISPKADSTYNNVYPCLSFLRNAKSMNIQVLDSNEKLVTQVAVGNNIRKDVFADTKNDPGYRSDDNWMWNGKKFNSSTNKYEVVPEGQYFLDYVTKIDMPNAEEKHLTIPVKVDLTAPEITVKSNTNSNSIDYNLQWEVKDNLSGDAGVSAIWLNGIEQKDIKVDVKDNVYSCTLKLDANKFNTIEIGAADNASNISVEKVVVKEGNVPFSLKFDNLSSRMSVDKADLKVTGSVSYVPGEFKINNKDVKINDDLTFSVDLKFNEGRNLVSIYALDKDGKTVLKDFSYKVDCDTIAPVLELTSPVVSGDGKTYTNSNTVNVSGKVSDNTIGYKLYINGEQKIQVELDGEMGNDANEKTFDYEIPVTNNSFIEVKVVDLFGHETMKNINVVSDPNAPVITVTGVEDGKLYNKNVTPIISANEDSYTAKLNGKDYHGEEITTDGKYELVVTSTRGDKTTTYKINFEVDKTPPVIEIVGVKDAGLYNKNITPIIILSEKGTITSTLNDKPYYGEPIAKDGLYKLTVNAKDLAGNVAETKTINFTIDKTPPVITITGVEEGKLYNVNVTPVIKTSGEDSFVVTLNDNPYNGEEITADGSYTLVVTAKDLAGNTTTKTIKFVVDKTAPAITITGVEEGKIYEGKVKPVIAVDDKEAKLEMSLNGKEYKGEEITAVGEYTLVVIATDKAGNSSTNSVKFSIKAATPTTPTEPTKPTEPTTPTTPTEPATPSNDSSSSTTKKLVKTGSMVDTNVMLGFGTILAAVGALFIVTKRKEQQ